MKALRRWIFPLWTALALAACAGTGGSGPGAVGGGGPVGGESGGGSAGVDAVGLVTPLENPTLGQATGDGTLGSQSSSVDLEPHIYRQYSLFFAGEPLAQGAEYDFVLPQSPGKLPAAQVLKIFKDSSGYKEVPCLACEGRYVRALNCGPHSDMDILQSMSPEEKNNPLASNPLLWYLLHMPRITGNSSVVVCEGATYRDFPVSNSGTVDLDELELYPNEIFVFYLLPQELPPEVGPLSTSGTMQIAKGGIAVTAKNGMIRYTRPVAPVKLLPQAFEIFKMH